METKIINKLEHAENALVELSDEIMSMLHANHLRNEVVSSMVVRGWLQMLHDTAQNGLGRPRTFAGRLAQQGAQADRAKEEGPAT